MTKMRIDQIKVGERRRKLYSENVEYLAQNIKEMGHLINPITVNQDGELICGLHRLQACKQLGMEEVPVNVIDASGPRKKLIEIDENLHRKELTVLDQADCLMDRKAIFEELHPGFKHGGDRRSEAAQAAKSSSQNVRDVSQQLTQNITQDLLVNR